MAKHAKYLFGLYLLLIPWIALGQNFTFLAREMQAGGKLNNSRITSVCEDPNGFIWMTTLEGVVRYDGYQVKWFTHANSALRNIPKQYRMALDDEGYLWLVKNGQLDLLHHQTFEIVRGEEKFKDSFPNGLKVSNLYQAKNGQVIFRADVDGQRAYHLYHPKQGFQKLPLPPNTSKLLIKEHSIWASSNGFNFTEYDLETAEVLNRITFPENKNTPSPCLIDLPRKGDWFGIYNIKKKEAQIIRFMDGRSQLMASIAIEDEKIISNQLFWYHAPSQLILLDFNKKNGQGIQAFDLNLQLKSLSNSQTADIQGRIVYCDRQGILWTLSWGKCTLEQIKQSAITSYGNRSLRGIWAKDSILLAQDLLFQRSKPGDGRSVGKLFEFVCFDHTNVDECWVGGRNGIFQFDLEKEEIQNHIVCKKADSTPFNPTLWSILKDAEGRWWGGTFGHGLMTTQQIGEDSLSYYQQYNEFSALQSNDVVHLLEDGDYIWASANTGLYLIDKIRGVVQKYASDSPSPYYLPQTDAYFLHLDKDQNYWVGTNTDGLIKFRLDEHMQVSSYQQFGKNQGLPSSIVYAVIEDDKERLWLSTNNGISCFNKQTQVFQNFGMEDGLTQLEFNRIAYHHAPDGQIFFGSLKGAFGFYPDSIIKSTPYDHPILLTNYAVYKNQQIADSTAALLATKKIVLQPSDQLFRLNIALLDIFNAPKIRYAYKIEGLFDNFQNIDGNTIEIGGLPYGNYQLRIQGRSPDGRVSQQELLLDLEVVRPFYLRWWFVLLAGALVLLSAAQVYDWRVRQLNERRRELELMVKQRTAQIEKDKAVIETQATQLKELDELRSKFFANISHELRTPLTLLLAPMESILKSKELSNRNFTYLQLMRQNGRRLLKRINELLDLSRLDANRLEVKERPTFLYPFFKTLLSTFESAANLKGIQLLLKYPLDESLQLNLDEDKVEKIISNLLSNAIKFTPKDGTIRCEVSRKSDQLLIGVSDTGIGILPSDLVKIFDRFYQSKNNSQQEGTGIGLSLCRELAKVLGGKVWATSEIGKGSSFYLELPIVESFATEPPPIQQEPIPIFTSAAATTTAQKFRPHILVVEDNADLRHYISMVLAPDYEVETAANGQQAIERFHKANAPTPQLLISDIRMPVMDGIELLKNIKQNEHLRGIPVIMLTARQSNEVKLEALRIGVDDYLTKPFVEEELKVRVANLIKNSQNRALENTTTGTTFSKPLTAPNIEWLKNLESILLQNIADKTFKLSDAANELNISYRRLQQKLKAITGLSPKQYQRSIKLAKARQLLKSGKVATLQEVMSAIGIDNYTYFTKLYVEEFGIKPIEELK
ncbi:MAG: ATP-binding protein [Bacteroidota bacterium]